MKVNLITVALIALVILLIGEGLIVYTIYLDKLNEKMQIEQFGFYDSKVCLLIEEQLRIYQIFTPIGVSLIFSSGGMFWFIIQRSESEPD
jgi:hypothetical protein